MSVVAGDEITALSLGYGHAPDHRLIVFGITRFDPFVRIDTGGGQHHFIPVNCTVKVGRQDRSSTIAASVV